MFNITSNFNKVYLKNAEDLFIPFSEKTRNSTKMETLIEIAKEIIFYIPKTIKRRNFIKDFNKQFNNQDKLQTSALDHSNITIDICSKSLKRLNSLHKIQLLIKQYEGITSQTPQESSINYLIVSHQNLINNYINEQENKKRNLEQEALESPKSNKIDVEEQKSEKNTSDLHKDTPESDLLVQVEEQVSTETPESDILVQIEDASSSESDFLETSSESVVVHSPSFGEKVSEWTGLSDLQAGVQNLRSGNYRKGMRDMACGSLKVATIAAVVTGITSYCMNAMSDPNDICQIPDLEYVCEGNFNIPRLDMPQVEGEAKTRFLETLGNLVSDTYVAASKLIPTQSEMNAKKVLEMVAEAHTGGRSPCGAEVLTAVGDLDQIYVIDGHHRYAACRILNGVQKIIQIKLDPKYVLSMLETFPGVTKAAL